MRKQTSDVAVIAGVDPFESAELRRGDVGEGEIDLFVAECSELLDHEGKVRARRDWDGGQDALDDRFWRAGIDFLVLENPVVEDSGCHAAVGDIETEQVGERACLEHCVECSCRGAEDQGELRSRDVVAAQEIEDEYTAWIKSCALSCDRIIADRRAGLNGEFESSEIDQISILDHHSAQGRIAWAYRSKVDHVSTFNFSRAGELCSRKYSHSLENASIDDG